MTDIDITTRLVTLAQEKFGKKIAPDDDLFASLGIDSVQALELLSEIEATFGIEVPDWEVAQVTTISGLSDVVTRRLG